MVGMILRQNMLDIKFIAEEENESTIAASEGMAASEAAQTETAQTEASSALEQWDLVTHPSGQEQEKNDKLASAVYQQIKGRSIFQF